MAVTILPLDPKDGRPADQMVILPGADGEGIDILILLHLLFEFFILLLHHGSRQRARGGHIHHAHEIGIMSPADFDLRVLLMIDRTEADILAFK